MSQSGNQSKTLWHGRYESQAAESLRKLNDSLPFDKRMVESDILCSIAYAQAIGKAAVLTAQEVEAIVAGLQRVLSEFPNGEFAFAALVGDIPPPRESRLS